MTIYRDSDLSGERAIAGLVTVGGHTIKAPVVVAKTEAGDDIGGGMTQADFLAANRCTVTKTSVNSAATSTQLLAANADRKSLTIVNTDANALYVDLSGGTATNACAPIATGGTLVVSGAVPTNAITGIWAADGAGAATIFEGA